MGHYKSNLRDLEFNLFEVLGRQEVLGTGPYEDVDPDTAREMLHEMARLAETSWPRACIDSDLHPPVFDPADGSVRLPESFKKSYAAYMDGGWGLLDIPGELGGTVIPPSLRWAVAELVLGANPGDAHVLRRHGVRQGPLLRRHRGPEEAGRDDHRAGSGAPRWC